MAKMVKEEHKYHPGMGLKVLGMVLFITGFLRYFGLDWSIVLMVLGVFLLIKACLLKYKK